MSTSATRKDIDDVLGVLDVINMRMDERFTKLEDDKVNTHEQIAKIMNNLDGFCKNARNFR